MTRQQTVVLEDMAAQLEAKGQSEASGRLRAVLAPLLQASREVAESEAAAILAVTPQTIRDWVSDSLLPGSQDYAGYIAVPVEALDPAIRLRAVLPDQPVGPIADHEIDAEIEALRQERQARRASGVTV